MATDSQLELQVIQIGMNTSDMPGTLRLYSEVLGFSATRGRGVWGPMIGIQNLTPDSRAIMWWMIGSQEFFQLEFFHHTRPSQRPLREDWRPADHGWTRFGVAVADFDATMAALAAYGLSTLTPPLTENGCRRAAFRDPYVGVMIEVIESIRRQDGSYPRVVYATSSVSDLVAARAFYEDVIGLPIISGDCLHRPQHEALWHLADAKRESFVVAAGNICLEIVRYAEPRGRPRPQDYRLSDQGIVNVALGSRRAEVITSCFERLRTAGYIPPHIIQNDDVIVGYIIEPEREVEFAAIPKRFDATFGFLCS